MTPGKILVAEHDGIYVLKLVGDVRVTLCSTVDQFLADMFGDPDFSSVLVDLTDAEGIDSTSLGLLAKLSIQADERFGLLPTLVSTRPDITRVLTTMGLDDVFSIVTEPLEQREQLGELPEVHETETTVQQRVIDAHHALMSINDANRATFQDLVTTLEASTPLRQVKRAGAG